MSEQNHLHRPTLIRTPSYAKLIERFQRYLTNNETGIIDHPIRYIEDHKLPQFLSGLHKRLQDAATMEELIESAKLAKQEHSLLIGEPVDGLTLAEEKAYDIQRSGAFWNEPKDLLLTLAACCVASMVQGWVQVANGNTEMTKAFGIEVDAHIWKFAIVQAIPWFSASILGSCLSDPLSEFTGRRVALFTSAVCSFTSSIAGSRVTNWKALVGTRVLLGLGIGGKASIVPILESEVVPASKRGRLLVSWQVFDAAGIFFGSIACYILRNSWRSQILSGAIPAFTLMILTFWSCESPRWLIIQGKYAKALTTLMRLRKERRLALMELVSIYYQTQAERSLLIRREKDSESGPSLTPFESDLGRTSWWERLRNMFFIPRIRRAAIAAMIVMIAQQLSGNSAKADFCCINIYAFLATQFYSSAGPADKNNEADSLKFVIGFGAANMIFSCLAYFLVENKEPKYAGNKPATATTQIFPKIADHLAGIRKPENTESVTTSVHDNDEGSSTEAADDMKNSSPPEGTSEHVNERTRIASSTSQHNSDHLTEHGRSTTHDVYEEDKTFPEYKEAPRFRGRRFLLLTSLASGVVTLFMTSMMFKIPDNSPARVPMIILFIIVFTAFYSPGAGVIPFLYCAEVFPNEGRELGMSWSTFWNFLGSGIVALFVPFGINWGHSKLLGLFSGLNAVAFILVWFGVYTTNHTATLEDYSYVFGKRMRDHIRAQALRIWHWSNELRPSFSWAVGTDEEDKSEDSEKSNEVPVDKRLSQPRASVPPHIRRVTTSGNSTDVGVEDAPVSSCASH